MKKFEEIYKEKDNFYSGYDGSFLISGSLGYAADFVTNDALLKVENVTREIQEEEYSLDSGVGEYKSTILVTDNGKLNVNSKAINIDYFLSNTTADTGWRRCAINVQMVEREFLKERI